MPTIADKITEFFNKNPHSIFAMWEIAEGVKAGIPTVHKTMQRMVNREGCPFIQYSHGRYRSVNARWAPWSFKEGVEFVRKLGQALTPHYNVALTGGVLHKRELRKDLDLIVFPQSKSPLRWDLNEVMDIFIKLDMQLVMPHDKLVEWWTKHGEQPDIHRQVEVWAWRRRRIDIFYMNGRT